mmetsp:Transcript_11718/g.49333  ORF Transcript_11718/g.49333 Transcript_11718/m.49333 type:complete len:262 (+) Transcript_11718:851-1636(+)
MSPSNTFPTQRPVSMSPTTSCEQWPKGCVTRGAPARTSSGSRSEAHASAPPRLKTTESSTSSAPTPERSDGATQRAASCTSSGRLCTSRTTTSRARASGELSAHVDAAESHTASSSSGLQVTSPRSRCATSASSGASGLSAQRTPRSALPALHMVSASALASATARSESVKRGNSPPVCNPAARGRPAGNMRWRSSSALSGASTPQGPPCFCSRHSDAAADASSSPPAGPAKPTPWQDHADTIDALGSVPKTRLKISVDVP